MKNEENKYQSPEPEQPKKEIPEDTFELLTSRIREIESERRKKLSITIIFLIFMSLIYIALGNSQTSAGLRLIAAGFMAGAIYLTVRARPLRDHHYLLPVTQFLKEAHKRLLYQPWQDLLVTIPILVLLGIGGGMHLTVRLERYTDRIDWVIIGWILFYLLVCVLGFYAGKKQWSQKYGKLQDDIARFLRHMNENQ